MLDKWESYLIRYLSIFVVCCLGMLCWIRWNIVVWVLKRKMIRLDLNDDFVIVFWFIYGVFEVIMKSLYIYFLFY